MTDWNKLLLDELSNFTQSSSSNVDPQTRTFLDRFCKGAYDEGSNLTPQQLSQIFSVMQKLSKQLGERRQQLEFEFLQLSSLVSLTEDKSVPTKKAPVFEDASTINRQEIMLDVDAGPSKRNCDASMEYDTSDED